MKEINEQPKNFFKNNQSVRTRRNTKVQDITMVAFFVCICYLSQFFHIKTFDFLTYDPKNVVVVLCGLVLGMRKAVIVSFITCFLEMITVSTTLWYGFLMNFCASMTFSLPFISLFNLKRNNIMEIVSGIVSTITLTISLVTLNLIITPLFLNTDVNTVVQLLGVAIIPFNVTKGVIDTLLIFLFYRPILIAMRKQYTKTKSLSKLNQILLPIAVLISIGLVITLICLMLFVF